MFARLQDATNPARVADVGCGVGWASIELAKAFPNIRVDGYDADEDSISRARRNAAEAGQPIGVFEYPERSALIILLTAILTPFLVAVATPFMHPFRWRRFLFTYLLPLVPLTCWWDGIISQLRAYTVDELESLAADAAGNSYEWRAGTIALPNSPGHLTYLLGLPLKDLHRARGAEAENRFEAVARRERIGGVT